MHAACVCVVFVCQSLSLDISLLKLVVQKNKKENSQKGCPNPSSRQQNALGRRAKSNSLAKELESDEKRMEEEEKV
tara:strand:- start:48 stop:275 length:228 start_codon:yes stop_codon:yes gene_type:complete